MVRTERAKRQDNIQKMAEEAFKDHVLKLCYKNGEHQALWRCGTPGTSVYHFNVMLDGCWLIVYGDINGGIFRCGSRNSVGWLRGAIRDTNYILSKLEKGGPRKKFYVEDADETIEEILEEEPEDSGISKQKAEEVREKWALTKRCTDGLETEIGFADLCYEILGDCELIESAYDYDPTCLWLIGALVCFVRLLNENERQTEETKKSAFPSETESG